MSTPNEVFQQEFQQRLEQGRSKAVEIAAEFKPSEGIMPRFQKVLGFFLGLWNSFEESCSGLSDLKARLEKGMSQFDPGKIVAEYGQKMAEANGKLRDGIRGIIKRRHEEDALVEEQLTALEDRRDELKGRLRFLCIALNGDESLEPKEETWYAMLTIAAVMALVTLIEFAPGYGLFQHFSSSSLMAVGASALVVLGITFPFLYAAGAKARILHNVQSEKNFQKLYVDRAGNVRLKDANGNPARVYPVEEKDRFIAFRGVLFGHLIGGLIVLWRLFAVFNATGYSRGEASMTLFAAAGIYAVSAIVFPLVKIHLGNPYHEQGYAEWQRLTAELKAVNKQIDEFLNPPKQDEEDEEEEIGISYRFADFVWSCITAPWRWGKAMLGYKDIPSISEGEEDEGSPYGEFSQFIKDYNLMAYQAQSEAYAGVDQLRRDKQEFLLQHEQYLRCWEKFQTAFKQAVGACIHAVLVANPDVDAEALGVRDESRMRPIYALFGNQAQCRLRDDRFVGAVSEFEPAIDLPAIRVAEFNRLIEEVESVVTEEESAIAPLTDIRYYGEA